MTLDDWMNSAAADADRRRLPALKPLLEALGRSLQALRASDVNDDAAPPPRQTGGRA
jgi:hypothetical protein